VIHPDIARWRSGTCEHLLAQEYPHLLAKDIERISEIVKRAPEGLNESTYPRPGRY
jgi:hypothetical protein